MQQSQPWCVILPGKVEVAIPMVRARRSLDLDEGTDLRRAIKEAVQDNEPLVLRQNNEAVATVRPLKRSPKTRGPRGRRTDASDPYWNIIGIADGPDDGIHDVSSNKHKYLAKAYEHGVERE